MEISSFIQQCSAFTGFIAAIFFALGVITQSPKVMLEQSQTYWDFNPVVVKSLSSQKAQYSIGVAGLLTTFLLQALSFIVPSSFPYVLLISGAQTSLILLPAFIVIFILLRLLSGHLAKNHEKIIKDIFSQEQAGLPGTPS